MTTPTPTPEAMTAAKQIREQRPAYPAFWHGHNADARIIDTAHAPLRAELAAQREETARLKAELAAANRELEGLAEVRSSTIRVVLTSKQYDDFLALRAELEAALSELAAKDKALEEMRRRSNAVKLSADEWLKQEEYAGLIVMDPDGWDRSDYHNSWNERINQNEFERRVRMSTCQIPHRMILDAAARYAQPTEGKQ